MSGFYHRPQPGAPLNQGDIFTDVPIIGATFDPLFQVILGDPVRVEQVKPDGLQDGMLLVEKVTLTRAIIISQSCDCERAPRLELAPLGSFTMEGKTPDKQWKRISTVATSLHETKSIYLPGNSVLGLTRSVADFGEVFTLPRKLLEDLAKRGRRVASLGDRAIEYLQFRLNVMRTRVAQDDYTWPSAEDLGIKIAFLDERIKELERKVAKEEEEAKVRTGEEKLEREEGAKWKREEEAELRAERARAVEAQKSADDVEGGVGATQRERTQIAISEIEPALKAPIGVPSQEAVSAVDTPVIQKGELDQSQATPTEPPDPPPPAPAA